jgi:hypothetical protein
MRRALVAIVASFVFLGAAPLHPLDSQIVLERYELEMTALAPPKAVIFTYNVSQAGPTNIEQLHRLYRSGDDVRDETLSVDGQSLKQKVVRIERREDRYAVTRLAPRTSEYSLVFLRAFKQSGHYDYEYEATPLGPSFAGFVVTRVVIDGVRDLPTSILFHTSNVSGEGHGDIEYGSAGGHWVPLSVTIDATIQGKPARERITWSDYRFPPSLPSATFQGGRSFSRETPPAF